MPLYFSKNWSLTLDEEREEIHARVKASVELEVIFTDSSISIDRRVEYSSVSVDRRADFVSTNKRKEFSFVSTVRKVELYLNKDKSNAGWYR